MRLLFVTENHPPDRGGMAESCDRIVRGLRKGGARIDVLHFDRRAVRPSFQNVTGGSWLRWPIEADMAHAINCAWNDLQRRLDLAEVTHVVAFGGTLPLLSAPVFAAWIRRPLVTMLRGNELDAGLFDPRRRAVLDDAIARSATVCTLTSMHAEKVAALYGISPAVVPNGIDFALWDATPADRMRARNWREAHVSAPRRVVGLFGDLKAKKGVPFFIDALGRSGLADRFHLLLIGEIEQGVSEILDAAAARGVTWSHLPPIDRLDLIPYFLACDLIALPSHYDGFPNVLIEAMGMSRPLIASNAGGMADVLEEGRSAFLFDPGDDAGCIEAIVRAATASDEMLREMGDRARAVAGNRCDAETETRRYLEVFHALRSRSLTVVDHVQEK